MAERLKAAVLKTVNGETRSGVRIPLPPPLRQRLGRCQKMSASPPFRDQDEPIPGLDGRTVGDFWQWAYSDLLSNRNRSILAEFMVGVALGAVNKPRVEWDAADLCYRGFKIEVKSSADCQSWHQEKPSTIQFSIRKAVVWNPATGKYEGEPTRCADLYIFCHYPERDKAKADALDVPAWDFYVVSTATLNQQFGEAKSLSLAAVRRVGIRCRFDGLKEAVDEQLSPILGRMRGSAEISGDIVAPVGERWNVDE